MRWHTGSTMSWFHDKPTDSEAKPGTTRIDVASTAAGFVTWAVLAVSVFVVRAFLSRVLGTRRADPLWQSLVFGYLIGLMNDVWRLSKPKN